MPLTGECCRGMINKYFQTRQYISGYDLTRGTNFILSTSIADINIFTAAFPTLPSVSAATLTVIPPILLAVAITFILFLSILLFQGLQERSRQSSWSDLPKYNEIPSSILRHKVTRKQLKELSGKIDVAVVGSGIGALSSASMLAKAGYKVAVFEKHYVAGGSSQTFEHEGYEFDVGVHYVGEYDSRCCTIHVAVLRGYMFVLSRIWRRYYGFHCLSNHRRAIHIYDTNRSIQANSAYV